MTPSCGVVELRRYRLRRGTRETLIELFDREFVETQEALGISVIGQFRDLDEPDHFVWIRGFRDMDSRRRALEAFYSGPVWARHRDRANATMINSDNVLLLRPLDGGGFPVPRTTRAAPGTTGNGRGLIVSTVCHLAPGTDGSFAELFIRDLGPLLAGTSAKVWASCVTERAPNDFPRLPVRERESVFVWFAAFADAGAYESHLVELNRTGKTVLDAMDERVWCRNEVSRLIPTARSLLQYGQ